MYDDEKHVEMEKAFFEHLKTIKLDENEPWFSDKGWRKDLWTENSSLNQLNEFFQALTKRFDEFCGDYQQGLEEEDRIVRNNEFVFKPKLEESMHKFEPDSVVFSIRSPASKRHWHLARSIMEAKVRSKADTALYSWNQTGVHLQKAFAYNAARHFMKGSTLCGWKFRVWRAGRSGTLASQIYNMAQKDGAAAFIQMFVGELLALGGESQGLDPTITPAKVAFEPTHSEQVERLIRAYDCDPACHVLEVKTDVPRKLDDVFPSEPTKVTQHFIILDVVFRDKASIGRGTTVFACRLRKDSRANIVTTDYCKPPTHCFKDSWLEIYRPHEGEILDSITKKNIPNVVQLYHYEYVEKDKQECDTHSAIRRWENDECPQDAKTLQTTTDSEIPTDRKCFMRARK